MNKVVQEEIREKNRELEEIESKLFQTKLLLQKLRVSLLAHERGTVSNEESNHHKSWIEFEKEFGNKLKNEAVETKPDTTSLTPLEDEKFAEAAEQKNDAKTGNEKEISFDNGMEWLTSATDMISTNSNLSRFYIKRRVIVGNTSQYFNKSTRNLSDSITHKWMIYVRANISEPNLESYVKNVTFFLHPTYQPNDIVTIHRPPFQLTRFGWGEFPVRVQLQFKDPTNKPVDIIHPLKLDQTRSGNQMLGTETVVDIELVRREIPTTASEPLMSTLVQFPPASSCSSPSRSSTCMSPPPSPSLAPLSPHSQSCPPSPSHSQPSRPPSPSHLPPSPQPVVINLPTANPSHVVLLDHDYHQRILVTTNNDSITPKVIPANNNTSTFHPPVPVHDSLDTLLHSTVRHYPLYGGQHSFSASSLHHYYTWTTVKRRANEWMRGVAIRNELVGLRPDLKTRQVVVWCRYHGYTPLESGHTFCKVCGHQIDKCCHDDCETTAHRQLTTISDLCDLIGRLESSVDESNEHDIDVLSLTPPTISGPLPTTDPTYRIPQYPELRWINRTANEVGVVLYPLSHDKMLLHVIDHMIFSACSQFLSQLLRGAVAMETNGDMNSSSERILSPVHLYKYIQSAPVFDFLTNNGMGLSID